MKLNTLMRPSMLPTAVCALPVEALPVSLPATAAPWAPVMVAERVRVPQAHQVLIQAELGKTALVLVDGNLGTNGFQGSNPTISGKRYTDGGSGVPPRGRPV